MSDTVKLIIEIPKEAKQAFNNAKSNDLKSGYYDHGGIIGKAIRNGIPLDDVKAEILEYNIRQRVSGSESFLMGYCAGMDKSAKILDNIGKAESEVKPNDRDKH